MYWKFKESQNRAPLGGWGDSRNGPPFQIYFDSSKTEGNVATKLCVTFFQFCTFWPKNCFQCFDGSGVNDVRVTACSAEFSPKWRCAGNVLKSSVFGIKLIGFEKSSLKVAIKLLSALATRPSLISMPARSNRPSRTSWASITNIFCCPWDRRRLPGNQPGRHQHQDTERLFWVCIALIEDFCLIPQDRIKTRRNRYILQVVGVRLFDALTCQDFPGCLPSINKQM